MTMPAIWVGIWGSCICLPTGQGSGGLAHACQRGGDLGVLYMPTNRAGIWGHVHTHHLGGNLGVLYAYQQSGDLGVLYMPANGVGIWGSYKCLPTRQGSRGLVHASQQGRDLGSCAHPPSEWEPGGLVYVYQQGEDLGVLHMPVNGVGTWGSCADPPIGPHPKNPFFHKEL